MPEAIQIVKGDLTVQAVHAIVNAANRTLLGGGGHDEDAQLASCYRNSLALALQRGLPSIAFPAISTGAYGFPFQRAAPIALTEARRVLRDHPGRFDRILFVCFGKHDDDRFLEAAARLEGEGA